MRAVQIKEGLASSPDYVNVGWAVIVEIDDHAQARNSEDGGHGSILSYSQALRLCQGWMFDKIGCAVGGMQDRERCSSNLDRA